MGVGSGSGGGGAYVGSVGGGGRYVGSGWGGCPGGGEGGCSGGEGVFRWGDQWGRGAKGQTLGGLKGSKGANVGEGGELNGTFLQFEFKF